MHWRGSCCGNRDRGRSVVFFFKNWEIRKFGVFSHDRTGKFETSPIALVSIISEFRVPRHKPPLFWRIWEMIAKLLRDWAISPIFFYPGFLSVYPGFLPGIVATESFLPGIILPRVSAERLGGGGNPQPAAGGRNLGFNSIFKLQIAQRKGQKSNFAPAALYFDFGVLPVKFISFFWNQE